MYLDIKEKMKRLNRNKYERIKFVRNLGYNTEENILVNTEDTIKKYQPFLKKLKHCSIRTFNEFDSMACPAHPILTKNKAYELIPKLQTQGYNVILATPINPKDCLFAGATRKTLDELVTEIANGPGTVRRITHEGKVDERYIGSKTSNLYLNNCLSEISNCHLNNVIFEFSYYKNPIGWKKENFIVWEITDDGTGESKV